MPFAIERNDLAAVEADAIVVAANERLQITGGVGMAVALAAGLDELQAACDEVGYCPCGSAVATPAFGLRARVVVHAVGPVWQGGGLGEAGFLRSAYDAALECAVSEGARSVALPLLSAGTYGFPAEVSLAVARESIRSFLNRHDGVDVRLVLYGREPVRAGMAAYPSIASYVDDRYMEPSPEREGMVLRAAAAEPPDGMATGAHEERARRPKRRRGPFRHGAEAAGKTGARREGAREEPCGAAADAMPAMEPGAPAPAPPASLEERLASLDAPFSTTLLALIDERGLTDAQVYKRANMSRQLFSKIRSDAGYRPTKKTALALAVALGLDLGETADLLARAGYALSASSKADVIVEYFIRAGNYDIFEINEALYAFDQPLL